MTLSRRVDGTLVTLGEPQTLTVPADPSVTLTPQQRTAAARYQEQVAAVQRSFTGALEQANQMKTRTTAIRRAVTESAADIALPESGGRLRPARHPRAGAPRRRDAARPGVGRSVDDAVGRQLGGGRRPRASGRSRQS